MIACLSYQAPAISHSRVLLVMLPGAGIDEAAFAANGMVDAVQGRGLAVDVIAVRPELELYLDDGVVAALHRDVIEPALALGYARIWLLGISMGGMGALLYASAYSSLVEGVVLLAPFLGTKGTIAEIAKAGGLALWSARHSAAVATERRMLIWLQDFLLRQPAPPVLYLGYGAGDRFASGHKLLAGELQAERVVTAGGGHDWQTWLTLWRLVLDRSPFAANAGITATGR